MSWTNKDGLIVKFGNELSDFDNHGGTQSEPQRLVIDLDPVNRTLPVASAVDATFPRIPAGAYITRADIISTETWTAAGAATLTVGLCQVDGTVIDADGIDVAIALAAQTAADVDKCDGALAGGVLATGAADGYVYFTVGTGPYTAGKGKLVIEYTVA